MHALLALFLAAALDAPAKQLARDIYEELIEINTTDSNGDNTRDGGGHGGAAALGAAAGALHRHPQTACGSSLRRG